MTPEELGQLYPIIIKPYNPKWKEYYLQERDLLYHLFSIELSIEHIGSTAVIGLSAKPTIDILLEKPAILTDAEIIEIFTKNGYIHMKEQTNHLMFVKGYTPTGLEAISYHVHMAPLNETWLWDRIFFRDYLNQKKQYRYEYEELKIALAKQYKHDREAYTSMKTDFIKKITAEAKKAFL